MHGVLFIFSYYFLNLRSIIFLQSPKQVHIDRSKCEHAVANRMLAFEAVYVEMLRWPDRFSHVQLPRFASQHHAIFLPRRIKHACSVKHLEFRNIPCAVLRFRPGARFERSNCIGQSCNPRTSYGRWRAPDRCRASDIYTEV